MRKYLFKFKWLLGLAVVFTIADAVASVLFAFVLKKIIDSTGGSSYANFYKSIIFSLIYLMVSIGIAYLRRLFQSLYVKNVLIAIKNNVFEKLLKKDIRFFHQENSGSNISILTNDISIIEQDAVINLFDLIFNAVAFVIATIAIIKISVLITITVTVVGALPILISVLFAGKLSKYKKVLSDTLAVFTSKVKDIFSGFEIIKSFNIEAKISREFEKSNIAVENSKLRFNLISLFVETLTGITGFLMYLGSLGIGAYLVMIGKITMGSMIAAIQLMNNIISPLVVVSNRLNRINSVRLIVRKIAEITEQDNIDTKGVHKDNFNTIIEFDDVSFSYEENRKILHGVRFDIKKGQKIAVVGESGSGKSTILRLLLRYYEDFDGKIKVDDVDNRDIIINDLYKLISIIHQNVFMFDMSIKDNITLFNNYSESEIDKAVKLSGLDELIRSLPEGVNSSVGENGSRLSGGEKQRIAIARALIKHTPVLVLDEATSSLDNETAYNIEKTLLSIAELTCLVITHKLIGEMLSNYDAIIVMKKGRIVESGSFDELVKNKGYFYSLYNIAEDRHTDCKKNLHRG